MIFEAENASLTQVRKNMKNQKFGSCDIAEFEN